MTFQLPCFPLGEDTIGILQNIQADDILSLTYQINHGTLWYPLPLEVYLLETRSCYVSQL